jgi:hypothetical protein
MMDLRVLRTLSPTFLRTVATLILILSWQNANDRLCSRQVAQAGGQVAARRVGDKLAWTITHFSRHHMTDIFIFESVPKEEVLKAIYDVELKNWKKSGASPDTEPQRDVIEQRLAASSNIEETLTNYATDGARTKLTTKDKLLADPPLTEAQAIKFSAAFLQLEKNNEASDHLHPLVTVYSDYQYHIEPKELSALMQASGRAGHHISLKQWMEENNVGLTAHGDTIQNGNEQLYIETRDGQRRTVSNGVITTPIAGYYGAVKDEALRVADGDYLDIYLSKDAYNTIAASSAYGGNILVMQMLDGGKPEELKVGYVKSPEEFKTVITSTFAKPEDFEAKYEGKYVEISPEQYGRFKAAVDAKPNLTLEEFAQTEGIQTKTFPSLSEMKAAQEQKSLPVEPGKEQVKANPDMTIGGAPEKPFSSHPKNALELAVASVDRAALQFHDGAAHANNDTNKVALVRNDKGTPLQVG